MDLMSHPIGARLIAHAWTNSLSKDCELLVANPFNQSEIILMNTYQVKKISKGDWKKSQCEFIWNKPYLTGIDFNVDLNTF